MTETSQGENACEQEENQASIGRGGTRAEVDSREARERIVLIIATASRRVWTSCGGEPVDVTAKEGLPVLEAHKGRFQLLTKYFITYAIIHEPAQLIRQG